MPICKPSNTAREEPIPVNEHHRKCLIHCKCDIHAFRPLIAAEVPYLNDSMEPRDKPAEDLEANDGRSGRLSAPIQPHSGACRL